MSESVQRALWHRLGHTPLRDALRGRLTARLDWRARIAVAELPTPAEELILRIVKRTRVWRIEKAAVADELAAHFRDGITADRPIEAIISEFGDERRAARLIRRAKIRNRPVLWHAWRWGRRGAMVLILIYPLLCPFYYFSRPNPTVDFLARLNAPIESVPPADRAWPIYRRVALALFAESGPQARNRLSLVAPAISDNVDGSHWPQMLDWLKKNQQEIAALRIAAARPSMGFVLGPDGSYYDPELFPGETPRLHREWSEFPLVIGVLVPQLTFSHEFAHALEDDAKLAQLSHDAPRFQADVDSILGIADQLRHDEPFMLTSLVADGVSANALDAIERMLRIDPSIMSDGQLVGLAHRLGGPRVAADIITLAGEKMSFRDVVQHVYTDNGNGNGHLTPAGLQLLFQTYGETAQGPQETNQPIDLRQAAGPLNLVASVSRKELLEKFDRLMDIDKANLEVPMRRADWRHSERMLDELKSSPWSLFRYGPVAAIVPDVRGHAIAAERYLGRRDGVVTAIALELYRREHGSYPRTLADLVPAYMPAVPADRITGDPIRYRLRDGKPLLYSVGVDRTDDGGEPASGACDAAAQWPLERIAKPIHGDWILYPVPTYMD